MQRMTHAKSFKKLHPRSRPTAELQEQSRFSHGWEHDNDTFREVKFCLTVYDIVVRGLRQQAVDPGNPRPMNDNDMAWAKKQWFLCKILDSGITKHLQQIGEIAVRDREAARCKVGVPVIDTIH